MPKTAFERANLVLFWALGTWMFWFMADRDGATDALGYPIAVTGVAIFAARLSPGSLLVMIAAISAGWTLGQGYMYVRPTFPAGVDTASVTVEGFLGAHQRIVLRLWEVDGGRIGSLGQESSRRYFLKGRSGLRHTELVTARFDGGDARVIGATAYEGKDWRYGKPYLSQRYSTATFTHVPQHVRALSSTCWFGATRVAWVVGDRPAEVSASMNVEQFAHANAGHHVLMTVEMAKR